MKSSAGPNKTLSSSARVTKGSPNDCVLLFAPGTYWFVSSSVRRRRRNSSVATITAIAATMPITMPAIAPPEMPECFGATAWLVDVEDWEEEVVLAFSLEEDELVEVGATVTNMVVWPLTIDTTVEGDGVEIGVVDLGSVVVDGGVDDGVVGVDDGVVGVDDGVDDGVGDGVDDGVVGVDDGVDDGSVDDDGVDDGVEDSVEDCAVDSPDDLLDSKDDDPPPLLLPPGCEAPIVTAPPPELSDTTL